MLVIVSEKAFFYKSNSKNSCSRGIYVTLKFFELLHVGTSGQTQGTFSLSADLNCNNCRNIFCGSIWREFLCPEQVKFYGFLTCSFHKM